MVKAQNNREKTIKNPLKKMKRNLLLKDEQLAALEASKNPPPNIETPSLKQSLIQQGYTNIEINKQGQIVSITGKLTQEIINNLADGFAKRIIPMLIKKKTLAMGASINIENNKLKQSP